MKITLLVLMFSFSGFCCKAYLSNMTKIQTLRIVKILGDKGFVITKNKKDSDIQIDLLKENFFNIYGYPHFFMREVKLNVRFDNAIIFSTYSTDGFPIYKAYSDVLNDLKESTFTCRNSIVLR